MYCEKCGAKLSPEDVYCPECGSRVEDDSTVRVGRNSGQPHREYVQDPSDDRTQRQYSENRRSSRIAGIRPAVRAGSSITVSQAGITSRHPGSISSRAASRNEDTILTSGSRGGVIRVTSRAVRISCFTLSWASSR